MKYPLSAVALTCALSLSSISHRAFANDSGAEVSAGGIVLKKQETIRMNREDLFISLQKVEVSYEFENPTEKDISTEVAFPMPPYEASGLSWPNPKSKLHGEQVQAHKPEFLDFSAEVEGKKIDLGLDVKGFLKEKDVTEDLKRLGINPLGGNEAELQLSNGRRFGGREASKMLSLERRQEAAKIGLIDSVNSGSLKWVIQATYYWKQVFPAHAKLHVKHVYTPATGDAMYVWEPGNGFPGSLDGCISKKDAKKIRTSKVRNDLFYARWIKYILVTAKNWEGPIGSFNLTVESPPEMKWMRTCFKGLVPDGKTTFKFSKEAYVPKDDLMVYFFR